MCIEHMDWRGRFTPAVLSYERIRIGLAKVVCMMDSCKEVKEKRCYMIRT